MTTNRNLIQSCLLCVAVLYALASRAQPVTKIATGSGHSLFLKSDGSLWAMGDNQYGQLGDGAYVTGPPYGTNRPELIVASNVTEIAAGYTHSLFLKTDGSLWAMGNNEVGQLGDGTTNSIKMPEQIVASGVTAMAAGDAFSAFTESDGSLWFMGFKGWGYGRQYNFPENGIDPTNYATVPQQIVSGAVTIIAAGAGHLLFLKNDGSLWTMGFNGVGQLGDGTRDSTNQPQQIVADGVTAIAAGGSDDSLFLKSDGSLWGMGDDSYGQLGSTNNSIYLPPFNLFVLPHQIENGSAVATAIAADNQDTYFLESDGSLWGLGGGVVGPQLHYNPVQIVSSGVTAIASGNGYILFIKNDGSLWGMGYDQAGQLGLGGNGGYITQPTQIVAGRPPPQLTITLSGTDAILTWPTNVAGFDYSGFILQSTPDLASPAVWNPVVARQLVVNGQNTVTNPISGTQQFYRLSLLTPPPGMALIPEGEFTMGDNLDGESDAMPTVTVNVSAFYMDANLVSYSQWQSVYIWATNHGYAFVNAGSGKAANHPVQTVDWHDAVKWCNARSQQEGLTPVYYTDAGLTQVYANGETTNVSANWAALGYRLPTEAEWEKAARGGLSGQRFPWGENISETRANYYGQTNAYSFDLGVNGFNAAFTNGVQPYTSPVGYFAPNGYGLYDMAGNVFEWCWDWDATPYAGGSDPRGPATGTYRVWRGGNWGSTAYVARCANRAFSGPSLAAGYVGFRCVKWAPKFRPGVKMDLRQSALVEGAER